MANQSDPISIPKSQGNIVETTDNYQTVTAPFNFSTSRNAKNSVLSERLVEL